jgi:hypothetical protein
MKSKKKEITRLKAKKVIFLDSERATSKTVKDELRKSDGLPIQRIGRKGLYGTVTKIAKDPLYQEPNSHIQLSPKDTLPSAIKAALTRVICSIIMSICGLRQGEKAASKSCSKWRLKQGKISENLQ